MKLLFIVNEPSFFLSHRLPIALAAQQQGYAVHVASIAGKHTKKIIEYGFVHHEISLSRSGSNPFVELISFFNIWWLLICLKPEIIHLVTIKPVLYGGIAARLAPVKKVVAAVSGLGTLFLAQGITAKAKYIVGSLLYKLALRAKNVIVIFQNPDDKKILIDMSAVSDERAVLIRGSGVSLNEYIFIPERISKQTSVTFAARLLFDKGLFEYIEAIQILNDRGVDAVYQLVGDLDPGNITSATASNLEEWGKIPNLNVLGYKEDIADVFSKTNIAVLPSYREGLPKVLIEAAACGRAVVTTDVPGCRDAIISGKTGVLVPAKDSVALANAIQYLVENPDHRAQMGKAGRKLAEEEFTIEHVVERHMDIYQELMSRG